MPIEIGNTLNGAADWVCGSPAVYGVLKNPIATALLVTALVLIIVFVVLRPARDGAGARSAVKAGFWIFVAVSALVFVHYYALNRATTRSARSSAMFEATAAIQDGVGRDDSSYVPVVVGRGEGRGAPRDAAAETPAPRPAEAGSAAGDLVLEDVEIPGL